MGDRIMADDSFTGKWLPNAVYEYGALKLYPFTDRSRAELYPFILVLASVTGGGQGQVNLHT